jgi:hypothetical protein
LLPVGTPPAGVILELPMPITGAVVAACADKARIKRTVQHEQSFRRVGEVWQAAGPIQEQ